MEVTRKQIRNYRLQAHHLDKRIPMENMLEVVGACGIQNSPPGAWETAIYTRVKDVSLENLDNALCKDKTLLQAWSFRGVPVIFPTEQSDIFLSPLIAKENEQPWIYTRGISAALDYLDLSFEELLALTRKAAKYLDEHAVQSKQILDEILAEIVEKELPPAKRKLWRDPSMYGEKQTVGQAAVSFLLRPCAFHSLVVFGKRENNSPTFTSFKNWTGYEPKTIADVDKNLVEKFLHCYGPTTLDCFMKWLGSSKEQAKRLWNNVSDEMTPVEVAGKTCYILTKDCEALLNAEKPEDKIQLLGPHDPYLDLRDREMILEDKKLQKKVWQFVSNPGVVLYDGRIIGIWKARALKDKLEVYTTLWEKISATEEKKIRQLTEEYAGFRKAKIRKYYLKNT